MYRAHISEGHRVTVIYISAGVKSSYLLWDAYRKMDSKLKSINLICADSEDLDSDEKLFNDMCGQIDMDSFVLLDIHGDTGHFKKYSKFSEKIDSAGAELLLICASPEAMKESRPRFKHGDGDYDLICRFKECGGDHNLEGILKWALRSLDGREDIEIPKPSVPPAQGIYHPDLGKCVGDTEYFNRLDPDAPTVGLMFHQLYWMNNDLMAVDMMIRTLESQGANVIPVFFISSPNRSGSIGISGCLGRFFMNGEMPRVCSVIMNAGFSQISLSNPSDGSECQTVRNFFKDLNVVVIQGYNMIQSIEKWREDMVGMGPMEIGSNVYWPEFDGQILSVPMSFTERDEEGRYVHKPLEDRIKRIASLALAWGALKTKPIGDIRVSILVNMYPPNNDRLGGAAGLDTFESISNLLKEMGRLGYDVGKVPESGKEVLDSILAGLTNDLDWVPDHDIPDRAEDMVTVERYAEWYGKLSDHAVNAIEGMWGKPPGEITTHNGNFVIPGVISGNVFIGIEPNRGNHAATEILYHSKDAPMPHQYIAYYRWIKHIFNTDLIVHMGTHGTLEWLPGKGNGLSQDCYPDIALDTIPNLYPYIIDDPGEGVEAKRRKNSVLIEYLMPTMTRAGSYDELSELDSYLQEHINASSSGQTEKRKVIGESIHEIVEKHSMYGELDLQEGCSTDDILENVELINDHISELKNAVIKDGLHILGAPPEGERMQEMIYCMTRLRNGNVPALPDAVCAAMGLKYHEMLDNPSEMCDLLGMTNSAAMDEIFRRVMDIIDIVCKCGFEKDGAIISIKGSYGDCRELFEVIGFICEELHPNILGVRNEIDYLAAGMKGDYVLPGPSGSPTRGNAHLLPTGRNYYSIDPHAIPSNASWKIGMTMADAMIDRYLDEKGSYPEELGIIIWATDTMKTGGDDIAYILWLMGVRPVWGAKGGRVTGLEAVPLDELKRPRVDVTARISGMFRDSFPNLVNMMDTAVEMISGLDESEDVNYLKKHMRKDIAELMAQGMPRDSALEHSMVRIFGDPPGEHGVGVDMMIETSRWDNISDITKAYVSWGSHAYGRKWKGERMEDLFVRRMSRLDVTVKNHNDREFDMLDIDDDYASLGGMNAVVKCHGEHMPVCVMGDSSDPDRLKNRTLQEETAFVMRSRVLNPKWIDGLKVHGFRGAQELSKLTEYMLGWDATSDNIDDWMFEAVADRFLRDDENREWIADNNPYALEAMISKLMEAASRGLWDAKEDTLELLKQTYLYAEELLEGSNDRS